jgi:sulfonate transport system ATP-binding protein
MSDSMSYLEDPFFGGSLLLPRRSDEDARRKEDAAEAHSTARAKGGSAIDLHAVSKVFGHRVVLDRLNLSFRPGQFVAVVGRSGGGKTTLLRLIAGLEQPDHGTVAIDGKVAFEPRASARLMFQDARLLPWQSVLANVGIARGPSWRERALAVLKEVGLADRAGDWPRVLSGGQRQRVALARALVSDPKILLLDEPFSALDALTRAEMHRLLETLWLEHRFTVVLITHDVQEAVALADRVIVLRDGAVACDVPVPLARPRREADHPEAVQLRNRLLAAV